MRNAFAQVEQTNSEHGTSLKIGEVSKQSGIGIEALRFYERSGLLGRPARTASGYRMYGSGVIARLAFIKRAQALGFTLDEIKQIIAESQSGQSPCAEVREIVRQRLQGYRQLNRASVLQTCTCCIIRRCTRGCQMNCVNEVPSSVGTLPSKMMEKACIA